MAGRRPLPTNVLKMRGNPGRRPLNENEPRPSKGKPICPSHLDDEAKREWKRTVDILDDMGLMTKADRSALAAYCVAWSRWVEAESKVREFGMIIKAPRTGTMMHSPYLSIANTAMAQMRQLLIEFGLTPAARTRVSANKQGDGDTFAAWERERTEA